MMRFDLHTHTTYSDGTQMHYMIEAAENAGLEKLGFADHANVSDRSAMKKYRNKQGFNLDITHGRRREAIKEVGRETPVKLYDAVEMDYDPRDEDRIRKFLEEAGFDYALGSVHHVNDINVHHRQPFRGKTRKKRRELVDRYFDSLVNLIESELFAVASHIDLVERNPVFRDIPHVKHYEKVADAFKHSRTVPEINAGRAFRGLEEAHPREKFRRILVEEGVEFTPGSDSHRPESVGDRQDFLQERFEELSITPVDITDN